MDRSKPNIQWQSRSSRPITTSGFTVTPQSQALVGRWPHFGFVWNRPAAILVEHSGQTRRIPVYDVTRVLQWGLFAISAICWIGFLLLWRQRPKE